MYMSSFHKIYAFLKGTVSRDFWPFLFAEKIRPGPHMIRLKQLRKLFHFREDIRKKHTYA